MAFAVVKFINTDEVAAVPVNWVVNDFCSWPPKTLQSIVAPHIEKGISPSDAWDRYAVKILGLFATYSEAKQKLVVAQESSDLNTTDVEDCGRGMRNKKRPARYSSESDEEYSEDLLGLPPVPDVPSPLIQKAKIVEHPHIIRCPVDEVQDSQTELQPRALKSRALTDTESFLDFLETPSLERHSAARSLQQIQSAQSSKQLGFERLVLHELNIIKGQQRIIMESMNTIMGMMISKPASSHNPKDSEFNAVLNDLPLADEENLKKLERSLQNQDTADKMVLYLSKIGGKCLESAIKNMLKRILSNELASEYSYLVSEGRRYLKI